MHGQQNVKTSVMSPPHASISVYSIHNGSTLKSVVMKSYLPGSRVSSEPSPKFWSTLSPFSETVFSHVYEAMYANMS